ncbi:uncharacterized protein G2W53_033962 [Senna tora]|uniref:Uncharacterized protein n=1 Tax=Senna tora TaxID=362788 RepID=A0A834T2C9_9FABA|nr:uncharacterized protein G2W53_033962 [Senna tora]
MLISGIKFCNGMDFLKLWKRFFHITELERINDQAQYSGKSGRLDIVRINDLRKVALFYGLALRWFLYWFWTANPILISQRDSSCIGSGLHCQPNIDFSKETVPVLVMDCQLNNDFSKETVPVLVLDCTANPILISAKRQYHLLFKSCHLHFDYNQVPVLVLDCQLNNDFSKETLLRSVWTVALVILGGREAPSTAVLWQRWPEIGSVGGSGPLMSFLASEYHSWGEREEAGFRRTLRIFLEDGGRRRVQWELGRQTTEEAPEKCVAARPLTTVARIPTQVKHDGRLLCWVPRAQRQAQQGSSVQGTDVMKRDVGVQIEKDEIVVLGDVRGAELAGMGETATTKVGESVPRGASCKGKAKNEALDNTNVTLRDRVVLV